MEWLVVVGVGVIAAAWLGMMAYDRWKLCRARHKQSVQSYEAALDIIRKTIDEWNRPTAG